MAKVSVVLPTYNRANTLLRAVQSVLSQTLRDIELIIVDDCSSDNTKEVLEVIDDDRVKLVFLDKNQGACFARNVGIKMATSDYIAFQDSSDEWLLGKLEFQLELLERSGCQATCASYILVKESGQVQQMPTGVCETLELSFSDLLLRNLVDTPTLVVRKSLLNIVGQFDENLPRFQDWELAIRIAKETSILFTPKPMTIAFDCVNSISRNQKALVEALEIIIKKHYSLFSVNKSILAFNYRSLATNYFFMGNSKMAIKNVFESMKSYPMSIKSVILLLFFCLPLEGNFKIKLYRKPRELLNGILVWLK